MKAKLIKLSVEDKPGAVAKVLAALADANINILSIFGWAPRGILQLIVDNPKKAVSALKTHGIAVEEDRAEFVELANKPGALHAYLSKLAKKGVNLRTLSGVGGRSGRTSYIVWTAEK
jgi:hypothetical protein